MKPHRFKIGLIITTFALITELEAQKKILDHTAYEIWQLIKKIAFLIPSLKYKTLRAPK